MTTNPTVATLVGISAQLNGEPPERPRQLADYEDRVRVLIDAGRSWATMVDALRDALAERPDLYPAYRVPSARMPSPDGFDLIRGAEVPYFVVDDDLRLGYTTDMGWIVYQMKAGLRYMQLRSFADLARIVDWFRR